VQVLLQLILFGPIVFPRSDTDYLPLRTQSKVKEFSTFMFYSAYLMVKKILNFEGVEDV